MLPGKPIAESELASRTVTDAAADGAFAIQLSDVAGRIPVVRIEPGTAIRIADLKDRPEINAGDEVEVEVRNGAMRICAKARAEQSGRLGDTIVLTNLQSSARFRARVEGRSKAGLTVRSREQR